MKKKLLLLLLCLGLCMALMPVAAFADDSGYTLDSEGNLTITSVDGATNWATGVTDKSVIKTITVGENVTAQLTENMGFDSNLTNLQTITFEGGADLTNGAFRNCLKVESVTFKGNAKLTSSALDGCTALKTLTFERTSEIINSGVKDCSALETMTFGGPTHIGSGALSGTGTTTLKELVFPEGSLLEPHGVFNNYTGLEGITFEGDITLGGSAFRGLDNLKTVVFNGKSTLKESAFSNCPKLESVTFEDETHIGSGALTCDSGAPNTVLAEVEVPDNSTMSENAFAYYTALKTVKLGKGAYFYNGAFYGADGITDVYFADETPVTFPEKALVYLNPAQVTLHVPTCDAVTAYTEELKKDPVDEADAYLHNAAFVSCLMAQDGTGFGYTLDSEGNLTILTNAGATAWAVREADKSVIKTITVGENVTEQLTESMGFDSHLTNLQTITFECGADLNNGAFRNCLKLESATFKGNSRLRSSALSGCTALKTLTFESSSEIIDGSVTGCSALETMTFGGPTRIGYGALSGTGTTTLKELVFPGGSSLEPHGVFNNYTGLESIVFEDNITLGGGAFKGLDNLKTVVFEGKSTLQDSAFSNCPKLESVTFKDTTHIKAGALTCDSGAPNTVLTEVEVPDNSTMSGNTFAYYTALKTVKLGKGAYFYWSAFYGADGITDVYFADETPVTFPEKALAYLNPAQVTLHVPTCDAVTAYATELKKDPIDEADADLHNAAFVSCLVADTHSYGVWTSVSETQHQRVCADNATHTETANHTFSGNTCTDCGYTKSQSDASCTHSTTVVKNAKDATCTEAGYTGDTYCKACGEKIATGSAINAKGHAYGDWTKVKEATETEKGLQERSCSVCNAKEQQDIPMLPPTETVVETKPLGTEVVKELTTEEIRALAGKLDVDFTGKTEEEQKQALAEAIEDTLTKKIVLEVEKLDSSAGNSAKENTTVYDAELVQITTDAAGVETKQVITKEYFKNNDTLLVTVPYPTGISAATANKYQFVVAHMFTVGEKAGEMEYPNDIKSTANGLTFSVTGLSPIAVSYVEKTTKPSSGGSSGGGGGGAYVSSTTTATTPKLKMELQIDNKDYKVNGITYTYDVAPFIVGDRTMVPVRVIMETLGAKVDWNEATRSVTITLDGKVMTMTIGKEIPGYGSAPIIRDNRTYVPIRYIMETAGAEVTWFAATGEIVITK